MAHRSRGCLRCRQRKVKCDRERPSCQRCLARNELCVGYREEADLMFQDETEKTKIKSLSDSGTSSSVSSRSRRPRSRSLEIAAPSSNSCLTSWLKASRSHGESIEDSQVADVFMSKYVMYPCNQSSSPGFLEHLPCLFQEVNVDGRHALRAAVQAAGFADVSRLQNSEYSAAKALECYGRALHALGRSLAEKGKTPDDYDLMTVVVLDIFESLYLPDQVSPSSHAQGMAHILRLRGYDQFYNPRGWGLFRLAHHRLQKQQLAKKLAPLPESGKWLESLDGDMSFVRLEKDSLRISTVCQKANQLLSSLGTDEISGDALLHLVQEMLVLDQDAAMWRRGSEWAFKTVARDELIGDQEPIATLPDVVYLYPDIWMAYEWNYHRTARVVLHQQLLTCLQKTTPITSSGETSILTERIDSLTESSLSIVRTLAGDVLSSAPQFFGDVDTIGRCISHGPDPPRCRAIGAYLLLWPIKIIKAEAGMATEKQKEYAQAIFERIRECTGMKSNLGNLSII